MPRRWTCPAGLLAAACIAGTAGSFPGCGRSEPPASPQSHLAASRRDVNAPVPYVGSRVCAECHADRHESYLRTAHSRSLSEIDPAAEPPDGEFTHDASGRSYRVYRQDGRLRHREWLETPDSEPIVDDHALRYLIGSGRHSRSYLVEADGFLVESPVTWYASRKTWDVSPGYDRPAHWGFERATDMGCLACHVGSAEAVDGSYHRIAFHELAIGCERCHGAGNVHVEWHRGAREGDTAADQSIVHPVRLDRERAEAICAQCHLRGDATVFLPGHGPMDFRPGQPLTSVRIDYRPQHTDGQMKVVGHMDQMWLSRCYMQSESLTCTTCHAMHATEPPADPRASFRGKCLDCHAELDCGVPREHSSRKTNGDDCVACHMPQTETDIPHIAFTHHRIGIHGGDRAPLPTDARQFSTLVPIQDVSHLAPELQDRCLGLGYLEYSARQSDPEARSESLRKARMLLEACVRRGAGDGDLLAGLARMAWEDRPGAALELAAQALAREDLSAGARLNAWFVLADLHFQSRRPREAAAALETLTRLRRHSEDWLLLGLSRRQLLQDDAVAALQQAAVISPFRPDIRQLMQQVAGRGNEATAPRQ